MEPKRLYRSINDRKFAGVAGGLAEYFVMDPLLIRLAFVILTLAGGGGLLIYVVLWIVTPDNPYRVQPAGNNPGPDFQQSNPGSSGFTETSPGYSSNETKSEPDFSATVQGPQTKERSKGSLIGGLVLITLGTLFLADEFIPEINFGDLWPVILIVIGVGLLFNTVSRRNSKLNQ